MTADVVVPPRGDDEVFVKQPVVVNSESLKATRLTQGGGGGGGGVVVGDTTLIVLVIVIVWERIVALTGVA